MLEIICPARISSFDVFTRKLSPASTEAIERVAVPGWNTQLAVMFMESALRELGYLRSFWPGRTFVRFRDSKRVSTNLGELRECGSLALDFIELSNDRVFVWIESAISPTKRVLDFLNEHLEINPVKPEFLGCLTGLKLRTIPAGGEVELVDIRPSVDLSIERVPDSNRTFADYWEEAYGIKFSQPSQPILIVKRFDREFHYPAETVYIDKFSLEKRLGVSLVRQPKPETPRERYEKLHALYLALKEHKNDQLERSATICLRQCAPTVEDLCRFGAFKNAIRVQPPMLKFQFGKISWDPLAVFDSEYGPVCGKKNILVTHVIAPVGVTDTNIASLISELGRAFSRYSFGKIQKANDLRIIRYDSGTDLQEAEKQIRSLSKAQASGSLAFSLAIVPDNDPKRYFSFKQLLPARTATPLQIISIATSQEILTKSFAGFRPLCIKILIKALREGESIWNLNNAAGLNQDKSLYVGIGFSRYPREGKVSKCAAVLHDAYGDRVSWRVFATPQERSITRQWFDTLLLRIRDIVESEKPSRLVFYRTGTMYPEERQAVDVSVQGCTWLSAIKVSFVSVLDAQNARFYLYDKTYRRAQNLPAGYAIVVNDNEVFLSTSNYDDRELRQGTVIPVGLKLEMGQESIESILAEYHDLTYLNWRAPTTLAKHPLVITIAERFAELTRENVPAESMFYLDL